MKHPRRTALLLALLTGAVTAGGLAWNYYRTPVVFLGPMVQQVTTDGFAVFCAIHGAGAVRADLHEADNPPRAGIVTHDRTTGNTFITFAGLEPAREYEYEILVDDVPLARHHVHTAPADDRALRFIALGDTGVGDRHQNNVARRMKDYHPDFIIHVGDLIYPRGRIEDNPRKFFHPYADLLAEVPIYVSLGNHEFRVPGVDPVSDAFMFPPNGPVDAPPERNYWFDYGHARFIAIDSNNDEPFFRDTIAAWLDETLASAADRWKILFFHEPVHTHGKYPPAAKLLNTIVPVLESRRAHLVLSGHNHMYERTHPLAAGCIRPAGEGTIYVTTGAGGANLTEAQLPMPETIAVWEDREHSFSVVDITPDLLSLRQIGETGRLIDEMRIVRGQ